MKAQLLGFYNDQHAFLGFHLLNQTNHEKNKVRLSRSLKWTWFVSMNFLSCAYYEVLFIVKI